MKMKNDPSLDEINYSEVIPDKTEEFLKEAVELRRFEESERRKDLHHKEELKTARILASNVSKYLHAINLLIDFGKTAAKSSLIKYADDGKTFTIPFSKFNFDSDLQGRNNFETFLERLRKQKCFKRFTTNPYSETLQYIFTNVDLPKLGKMRKIIEAETVEPTSLNSKQKRIIVKMLIENCSFKDTRAKLTKKLVDMKPHKLTSFIGRGKLVESKGALKEMVSKMNKKLEKEWWLIYGDKLTNNRSTYQLKRLT